MSTVRTFRATHANKLALHLPTGTVRVSVDPAASAISVLLSTADDRGPAADAVNTARMWEDHTLTIDVPETAGNITAVGGRGTTVIQSFGTVTGSVTGVTIVNGRVITGGAVTVDRHPGTSPVTATVILPPSALGMAFKTISADLTTTGHIAVLTVSSTSGDVDVESVNALSVTTVSGNVTAGRIGTDAEIRTTSGDVRIDVHEGHAADVRTVSGDVRLAAGTRATGRLGVRTVSGDIRLHNTAGLDVTARTVSGLKRQY
ncbi:DUF4097 family beta strand repeat-containing protein [Kitasatospora sp. NPDC093558]|uniref:DUF4097 family beta strand repeat-containing protein n=1 Tax=Kitasatospora sp. NPDC093558 TaxID=3155201 RepID=UPI00344A5E2E